MFKMKLERFPIYENVLNFIFYHSQRRITLQTRSYVVTVLSMQIKCLGVTASNSWNVLQLEHILTIIERHVFLRFCLLKDYGSSVNKGWANICE